MKLVDANVLLYAVNADAPHHAASRGWLNAALAGADRVGLAWLPLLAFVRLATKIEVFPQAMSSETAMAQVTSWLAAPGAVLVQPTARHPDLLTAILLDSGTGGNVVNDAHLAALALEHRAEIVTYDTDFSRFRGIRWYRPDQLRQAAGERGDSAQ